MHTATEGRNRAEVVDEAAGVVVEEVAHALLLACADDETDGIVCATSRFWVLLTDQSVSYSTNATQRLDFGRRDSC